MKDVPKDAWYCGVLAALGLGFALVPLIAGRVFFDADNGQIFYPLTDFLDRALRAGELPQWWPEMGAGFPVVAAAQSAHFHPLRLLVVWLFDARAALMVEVGVYVALAGVSMYAFLRSLDLRREACLLGSIAFMFSAGMMAAVDVLVQLRTICVLPLAMFFAERLARNQRWTDVAGGALVFGWQFLAGYPGYTVITAVAATAYLCGRTAQRSWHAREAPRRAVARLARTLASWTGVVLLGAGVGAVQMLPTLLHVDESIRAGGFSFDYAMSLSARVRDFARLVVPYGFHVGHWLEGGGSNPEQFARMYIGATSIVLALLAILWPRRWPDAGATLVLCVVVAAAFALGPATPLYPAFWSLPVLGGLRFPFRFLLWVIFGLAALAALGLHRALDTDDTAPSPFQRFVPLGVLLLGLLFTAVLFWTRRPEFRSGVVLSLIIDITAITAVGALLVAPRTWRRGLVLVVVVFLLADLGYYRWRSGYGEAMPSDEVLEPPAIARFLQADPDTFRYLPLAALGGGRTTSQVRRALLPNIGSIWGLESPAIYDGMPLLRPYAVHYAMLPEVSRPETHAPLARFLGTLNVKYLLVPSGREFSEWEQVFDANGAALWLNPAYLPRAFAVGRVVPEPTEIRPEWREEGARRLRRYRATLSPEAWSTRLFDAQLFDHILDADIDYSTTAFVSGIDADELTGEDPRAAVRVTSQGSDKMSFEVTGEAPAFLVVSNSFYPGWTAEVNGVPTEVHRANWLSMGVFVPSGTSQVEFRFVTPGVRLGGLISLMSVALVVGLFVRGRRKGI